MQSTSSNAVVSSHKKRRSGGAKSYRQLVNDPAKLAYHLMDKSNKLHSAHVQQTMTFYGRLKEYITYISTPSQSPADARLKQKMADKIFELMKQEEVKLVEKRPLSSQLGKKLKQLNPILKFLGKLFLVLLHSQSQPEWKWKILMQHTNSTQLNS